MRPILLLCYLASCWTLSVSAQSSGDSATPTPSISLSVTAALTTSSIPSTTVSRSRGQNVPITTVVPTVFSANVTHTATITPTASATASPTPAPIVLDTKIDPAFGVLGAILIITGLPSAFWGHKNRWTSFFLIGFYTLSLVCVSLILKFGVLSAVNPPNKTLRGMFVLASVVAGTAGGGITVFFWKASKYFIGAWGGFAFGLFIQCFRNGGLIAPVGLRWIMYIGCAAIGFVLCTIPKLHWHILLVSTAFVGSSVFMLGVDCYTTAGLKEFYIWNIGFKALFPKYINNGIKFPVSQTMQIELGLMGAVALMGGAVQLRVLGVLQRKLREIAEEQKKRDEEAELHAAERFAGMTKEREEWERDHPTLAKHGRQESGYESSTPLMKERDNTSRASDDKRSSTLTFGPERRSRYLSGVSDLMASEEDKRSKGPSQSPGALPAMDLGLGIEDDVPRTFLDEDIASGKKPSTTSDIDELNRKEALLSEIQAVRKSIDALRSESPSSDTRSRHLSLTSRRTLSYDLDTAVNASHLRPPRQADPRARVQSMELDRIGQTSDLGDSIGRPTSAPLKDDWNAYVQDRKLLQPPSGYSAPIATTPVVVAERLPMPQAVADAVAQRKQRESAFEVGDLGRPNSSSPRLLDPFDASKSQSKSKPSNVPVNILPPRRTDSPIVAPTPQRPSNPRTATYEELTERHRQKMREMQAPLTQAQKEQADLEAAKSRWERSNYIEKSVVTKRQAEQAALLAKEEKKRKSEDRERVGRRGSMTLDTPDKGRHSRSLSSDKLAALGSGTTSKRASTMKVEDWQKHQKDASTGSISKRDSRPVRSAGPSPVPFPETTRRDSGYDRRGAGRSPGIPRDPPN